MSYTDEEQLQHLLNLGALVDSSVTHQEHKGIITKLYGFYKRCLETEPGEEEPQLPSVTELCSVLPHMEIDDPSITTTQAEEPSITTTKAAEPSITTTQAAEIEAPSDSVSKTIKHQLSHQSIQNPLPLTKRYSKRLQALPKTQAGRVLQGFKSSYSLRNPTGQGLILKGGIPISAKDCEQLESETQVPTEEAPITSGSQQTLPAGVNVGFQSGAVTSIELMEKNSFTAEEVSQALDNFLLLTAVNQALESTITMKAIALILRPFAELPKWAYVDLGNVVEEVCEMMRVVDDNLRPSTVFKNIDPKSSSGFIVVYEELLTVLLQSSSLKSHNGPDGESVIDGAGIKKVTKFFNCCFLAPSIQTWSISSPRMQQNQKSNLNNNVSIFFLLGPQASFTANSQDHQKQARWHSLAKLEVTKMIIEEELKKGEMGMHWARFGNLRKQFLIFASLLTLEEID
ncbi:hypothetical protein BY996DRAFT_8684502 [Phakopsora pachyrhizi]|nr:hypothetical protein BY996DRAFT_8684502 [Phakopsora pachyrhizi]